MLLKIFILIGLIVLLLFSLLSIVAYDFLIGQNIMYKLFFSPVKYLTPDTNGPTIIPKDFCKKIVDNGDPGNKIDIVFIPDNYSDLVEWSNDVKRWADINGNNSSLFSTEPLKSNKDKFNIWRIDLVNKKFYDPNIGGWNGEDIKNLARDCVYYDMIFWVYNNKNLPQKSGGIANYEDSFAFVFSESGNVENKHLSTKELLHEFGHAFVNLGDEYENARNVQDFSDRPNIDKEGCPKWCSGKLNKNASCYNDYMEFRNCLRETMSWRWYVKKLLTQSYDESCHYPEICDLGNFCLEKTGCYWNAKSLISFKSSAQSIMQNPESELSEFNLISREAIQKKIDQLIKR